MKPEGLTLKRGDTVNRTVVFSVNGEPQDLTGVVITSSWRDARGETICEPVVTPTEETGQASYFVSETVSAEIPFGVYRADLKFIFENRVAHSQTFPVRIVEEITE